MNLEDVIRRRLDTLEADILSGSFVDRSAFNNEVNRLIPLIKKTAILTGVSSDTVDDYLQDQFVSEAVKIYERNATSSIDIPDDYAFAARQTEIEDLIEAGNLAEADAKIDQILSILDDEDYVRDSITDGLFKEEDIAYFKNIAYPHFQELKDEKIASEPKQQGFWERLKNGTMFVVTGKNPYDNKTVKVKREKQSSKNKFLNSKFANFVKKHKIFCTAAGLAIVFGAGIFIDRAFLHTQVDEGNLGTTSPKQTEIDLKTFEVDENHNFNINDQETHTEKLQLLAQAVMERGVPVVSEEECMKLSNEGKLAVSPEQLNNWLITINLEDMDELTFTKLLADSDTDKEELSSDFNRVNNILGAIYTTKEENAFIYEFLSNKEYSEYIKAYEEAIIQNQKGESDSLITLIKSRVENPVAATSSGPLGMLSTSLIYQQANVYNAEVVGQDIMDLYNVNYDCLTDTTSTFYSDDWAEYMRKLDSKFDAAITYTGSEVAAYAQYLLTLPEGQDGNKVVIEDQVLPYLETNKVQLGEWDILENIENNNRQVKSQSSEGSKGTGVVTTPVEVEIVKTVSKQPETEEEKKVQTQVEAELEKENRQNFEDVIDEFAKKEGGIVTVNKDGDFVILKPGEQPIVVDTETKGAYDASQDYQGTIYDGYKDYMEDHRDQIDFVEGVGNVVVTEESKVTITNPNVYMDGYGNIIDKTTGDKVITGSKEEIDEILNRIPGASEWTTVGESGIHYSDVDSTLSKDSQLEIGSNNQGENNFGNNNSGVIVQPPSEDDSVLDEIDQGILDILTPEEQAELEEMLNGGREPVAGEVVEEEYSDIVYGNYTISQLMGNLALCENIPEDILRNQFPEIWSAYQNWLGQQQAQAAAYVQEEVQVADQGDLSAQIAALEAARTELVGEGEPQQQEEFQGQLEEGFQLVK